MIKRIVSILLILTSLVCVLCSCGDDEGVTLLVPVSEDPLCLDPQTAENETAQMIVSNCYEGLVRLSEDYTIIPGVAERWDISADGKTYTFHLRKDTNWQVLKSHKGILGDENYLKEYDSTVKAKDFVFGLQRAVLPITDAVNVDKILCIKNAKAVNDGKATQDKLGVWAKDDFTLVITLDRANGDFLRALTLPICMPCHEEFFNKTNAKYGMEVKYTFCNGPFYVSRWTDDNAVSIIKNDGYKGNAKVNPEGVYFYVNTDEESVVKKLKQNSYDCALMTDTMLAELSDNSKIKKVDCNNRNVGLAFNCAEPTVTNANIRKALLSAIDNSSLNITATGIVPDCVRFGEKSYRDVVGKLSYPLYNEQNAIKLYNEGLKELGIESAEITIICDETYSENIKKMIQNWQKAFGTKIIAKVEVKTDEEITKAVSGKNYQIAVYDIECNSSYCIDILTQFTSLNENNIFNYKDTTYDTIVSKIINTADGDAIIQQCRLAENTLIQNGVFYPLYKKNKTMALNKNLKGIIIEPSFNNIYFLNGDVE